MSRNSLRIDDWLRVLDNNDFSKYSLLLTGGEPSLHKDINSLIECSIDRFKDICVNTNGFDSSWIDSLSYKKIHVQVSLDGTPAVHNSLRSNNCLDVYSMVNKTIEKLEVLGVSYNISTTVSRDNYHNVMDLLEMIYSYKTMKYWKVSPQLPFGCGSIENTISVEEWNSLVDSLLDNSRILLRIKKLYDFTLLEKIMDSDKYLDYNIKTNCGNVSNKLYVYPDLTVYPCTCLTDFPLGNLKDSTLLDIFNSEESYKFINYKVEESSDCYDCKYLKLCNGGCIGMSYNYFGKLGKGDYRCPFVKK
ncbi:radical SAM protein [Mobilitalea sibirica]|uniref:Radical SAM protein n=2 Tax=Mobilitalea sibirica TaxID=1462919 RepID=A0A8J7H1Z8_9FIRM|nr:radical SAM protein [Mobilitalea sibirica]